MNHKIQPYLYALLFLIALSIILFLTSCSTVKQTERKDNKALDRVMTNSKLLNTAFARGLELNPCINDTNVIYKEGKTDSVFITVPKIISDNRVRDSLLKSLEGVQDICNERIKEAFDLGVTVTSQELSKIKVPTQRIDTIKYKIVDRLMIKMLEDTVNSQHNQLAYKTGQIDQLQSDKKQLQKRSNRTLYWAIGIVILAVLSHIARSYIKIPFT